MSRQLDTVTLDQAAIDYARMFDQADQKRKGSNVFVTGPSRVMQDFFMAFYKDTFEYLFELIRDEMGKTSRDKFDTRAKTHFKPRSDEVLREQLEVRLAVDPDGEHIPGKIGTVSVGNRIIGMYHKAISNNRFLPKNIYWPIYAGEGIERSLNSGICDPLPAGAPPLAVGALNTRISNELAIAMVDQVTISLDEGSTAASIRGRSGAQPAGADETESGTLLFTLTCSDPAILGGSDDTPGGIALADTITDDSSADATGTLGYCRGGATGAGADDHIDGEAAAGSGGDFNFNTLSIVAGATVSMTSWSITMPES